MKIVIRERADEDLDAIFAWIEKDNPRAAANMIRRLRVRIGRLAIPGLAHMGRPGLDPGTRELVEPPYIIAYEVHEERGEIEVLYIVHGAQDRAGGEPEC
ncbi:MAG: toxin ParE1/3/4 [Alphaproteobacteria bacterium]|jgi:toxin ParE1/3/4|nr:toxin ParE1/3/4 [Alphaproteobacteria bacterium]